MAQDPVDPGADTVPPGIDASVPQSARVYDYMLGGKDNFPPDRAMGDAIIQQLPSIRAQLREQRAFLGRAVRFLAAEAGVRQFLDIGTGIPSAGNVHDVAQAVDPEARVLYVDNDPLVLAHARALRPGSPQGRVTFIQADLRDPEAILAHPAVAETLDLTQPVGLVLVGVLHHLREADDPRRVVATLVAALPSGSYLTLTQLTADVHPETMAGVKAAVEHGGIPYILRSLAETEPFFAGLELVDPGLVPVQDWRPDGPHRDAASTYNYGGVARKP